MRARKGRFAVVVSENDKWLNFADLSDDEKILDGVIDDAKEYAKTHGVTVIVYLAVKEIEISPDRIQ